MSRPPDDVRTTLLWRVEDRPDGFLAEGFLNPEANQPPCQVYWVSHGCERPRGHEGPHWCDCCECEQHPDPGSGCVAGPPYLGPETRFYGDDAP